jgi:hypothetical protein
MQRSTIFAGLCALTRRTLIGFSCVPNVLNVAAFREQEVTKKQGFLTAGHNTLPHTALLSALLAQVSSNSRHLVPSGSCPLPVFCHRSDQNASERATRRSSSFNQFNFRCEPGELWAVWPRFDSRYAQKFPLFDTVRNYSYPMRTGG